MTSFGIMKLSQNALERVHGGGVRGRAALVVILVLDLFVLQLVQTLDTVRCGSTVRIM